MGKILYMQWQKLKKCLEIIFSKKNNRSILESWCFSTVGKIGLLNKLLAQLIVHLELTEILKACEKITSRWIKDLSLRKETRNLKRKLLIYFRVWRNLTKGYKSRLLCYFFNDGHIGLYKNQIIQWHRMPSTKSIDVLWIQRDGQDSYL